MILISSHKTVRIRHSKYLDKQFEMFLYYLKRHIERLIKIRMKSSNVSTHSGCVAVPRLDHVVACPVKKNLILFLNFKSPGLKLI